MAINCGSHLGEGSPRCLAWPCPQTPLDPLQNINTSPRYLLGYNCVVLSQLRGQAVINYLNMKYIGYRLTVSEEIHFFVNRNLFPPPPSPGY